MPEHSPNGSPIVTGRRREIVLKLGIGVALIAIGLAILNNLNSSVSSGLYTIEWFLSITLPIAGIIILLYAWAVWLRGFNRRKKINRPQYKLVFSTGILAGTALIVAVMLQETLMSLTHEFTVTPFTFLQNITSGLFIGVLFSSALDQYYQKIPTNSTMSKSLIITMLGLVIIVSIFSLLHLNGGIQYFLVNLASNIPSYIVLAVALGFSYRSIKSQIKTKSVAT